MIAAGTRVTINRGHVDTGLHGRSGVVTRANFLPRFDGRAVYVRLDGDIDEQFVFAHWLDQCDTAAPIVDHLPTMLCVQAC